MNTGDVDTGGLAPLVAAAGVAVPRHWRESGADGSAGCAMRLSVGGRARENGTELLERVREAVARVTRTGGESAVRELRRLVAAIPSVVQSVPEFVSYVRWLAQRDLAAVRHIMEAATKAGHHGRRGRGRPHETHAYLVKMVDLVQAQEGGSVATACRRLLEELSPSPFGHFTTVKSMENAYSRHRDLVHAQEEYWIPAEELARVPMILRNFI